MAGPRRAKTSPIESLSDERCRVAMKYRIMGFTQNQIADRLERDGLGRVTYQAVHAMLVKGRQIANREMAATATEWVRKQAETLQTIIDESLAEWDRSKQAAGLVREKSVEPVGNQGARGTAGRKETVAESREQCGDRGYLETARGAMSDLRQLLGLNAPQHVRLDVNPDEPEGLDAASSDVLRELLRTANRLADAGVVGHNGTNGHADPDPTS